MEGGRRRNFQDKIFQAVAAGTASHASHEQTLPPRDIYPLLSETSLLLNRALHLYLASPSIKEGRRKIWQDGTSPSRHWLLVLPPVPPPL